MTGIVGAAVIQLGKPLVPLQTSDECQLLEGPSSQCRPKAGSDAKEKNAVIELAGAQP